MAWTPPELPTDEDAVTARILDAIRDKLPGWTPVEGAVEVALAEEIGRETANLNAAAVEGFELAIAALGETAFGFTADQGSPATIEVTLAVTSIGAVVPAGFSVVGTNDAGDDVAFRLLNEVTAAATSVPVVMTAVVAGDRGNQVPPGDLLVVTSTSTVVSATATSSSSGGADAETLQTYLGRFSAYLSTLRPGGVRAEDLAALAASVPGVHRALGIDLHDPTNPGVPQERTATVVAVDDTGHPIAPGVATNLQDVLEAAREVNFNIWLEDPTYTPVTVVYTAVAEPGADPAAVEAAVEAAVMRRLTDWGTLPGDDTTWINEPSVRYLDIVRVAGSAPGVAFLSSLTLNGAAADLALPGVAPMPARADDPVAPSTVTGTVTS